VGCPVQHTSRGGAGKQAGPQTPRPSGRRFRAWLEQLGLGEGRWGAGGVPGWMKPPKPFPPRKLSVLPGYKRQGYQADQECGGGKYTGEWKDGQSGRRAARTHRPRMHACMLSSRVRAEA